MNYFIKSSIFLSLLTSIVSSTHAVNLVKKDKLWFVNSENCKDLDSFTSEIISWASSVDHISRDIPACSKTKGKKLFEVNLTEILPEKVSNILSKEYAKENGHNCWNFSLFSQGLVESLRYSGEREFSQILEKVGICKKLEKQEMARAGDIIALRVENRGNITELHTYVYLSKDIMMHKKGSLPYYPYELASANEVDLKYKKGIEDSCSQCHFKKSIYRCDGGKRDELLTNSTTKNALKQLHNVECLHGNLSSAYDGIKKQFHTKSEALERLASSALETSFIRYMETKDKTRLQKIEQNIKSWLYIKFQLNSLNAHY